MFVASYTLGFRLGSRFHLSGQAFKFSGLHAHLYRPLLCELQSNGLDVRRCSSSLQRGPLLQCAAPPRYRSGPPLQCAVPPSVPLGSPLLQRPCTASVPYNARYRRSGPLSLSARSGPIHLQCSVNCRLGAALTEPSICHMRGRRRFGTTRRSLV